MPAEALYLRSYLAHLDDLLALPDVTDIWVNRPGEAWTESLGGKTERIERPGLTEAVLERLARQIAARSAQGISREHPLLSASLADGTRVQIVSPPATRGDMAFALRKHVAARRGLDDYVADGGLARARVERMDDAPPRNHDLKPLLDAGRSDELLREAVRRRRNILVSGGTSTGKTTFLNALLAEVPDHERLILIEDTPELQLRHANAVGLIAPRSALGEAQVTANDLLAASLRMRPDRIIVGELRGDEAFTFLRAVNTGHPGSMTTIHADTPQRAIEQLALLVLQSNSRLTRQDIHDYVRSTIDLFVQLGRDEGGRHVSAILLNDA
jgi:type IV secretion system protein VirB11